MAPAAISNKVVAISLSLFANMARSTSRARDTAKVVSACPAANSIAARVVMSQSAGETKAEAESRAQYDGQCGGGQDQTATGEASAEFFLGPSKAAANCPSGALKPVCSFGQRQSLEVTEDQRHAKRPWQPGNLVVKDLGLLADHRRHVGRRGHRLGDLDRTRTAHGVVLLVLALAAKPGLCLLGRAQRHPVEPASHQVGLSDRASLAGQDEEDGLKGILGKVAVAQDLAADAQAPSARAALPERRTPLPHRHHAGW